MTVTRPSTIGLRPAPAPGMDDAVVRAVTDKLRKAYAADKVKADKTVKEYGLTIEFTKLKDSLARSARTELQRLLLSVPGVVEKLFNAAISEQLQEEERLTGIQDDSVRDSSVDQLASALGKIEETLKVMAQRLEHQTSGKHESNGQGWRVMSLNGLDDVVADTAGLTRFILEGLPGIESVFFTELTQSVADSARITLSQSQRDQVVRRLGDTGIDLRSADIQDTITRLITSTNRESGWATIVDAFAQRRSLALPFTQRQLVIAALDRLQLSPTTNNPLLAQVFADVTGGAGTDPVQLTRPVGHTAPWDFRVDLFESARDQIVLESNVRAAGALMWCYDIGERLGVYKLADALVYRWWTGLVDFGDPDLTSELYRYYKLRDERPAEEERFLLYRRILNVGSSDVGDRVVVNEEFPAMWRTLMEEIATYIDRTENSFRDHVNRQGVEQAIRELQYNLTERMAGMALTQVTEMYHQLHQTGQGTGAALGGLDILGHPEVVGQLASGRRRDEWSVIERLAKEEFGTSPNVSALRTSAVEAFKVVDYIASFTPGQFDEDRFNDFIRAAKAWIITQQLAGDGLLVHAGGGKSDEPDVGDDGFPPDDSGDADAWDE